MRPRRPHAATAHPSQSLRSRRSVAFYVMMLKTLLLLVVTLSTVCAEDAALDGVQRAVAPVIRQYFPEAEVKRTDTSYIAKHGVMQFTVHGQSKTGEIAAQTHQEEGPNYRGFILDIALQDGRYQGAAVIPQHLKRPYWTTFIDAAAVAGEDKHLWIRFSYGGRLDPEFQKALLAALPKSLP